MKLSSNFIRFHDEFGIEKTIDIFSEAGFDGIDFNADLKEYYTDVHDEKFYKRIRAYANERGITFFQAHAPFPSSYPEEERSKERFDDIVRSMKNSALVGAEMIVVHPCKHVYYKENDNYELMWEYNLEFYKKLIPYAEKYGIKIAVENKKGCIAETAEGFAKFMDELGNDIFTVCYDVGHANICDEDPAEMIRVLGKRIGYTHIHDNDGVNDLHTLPYHGTIDWESVMKAFAEIGYDGNINYEAGLFVDNVPLSMRAESAKYMAKVGRHLIERCAYYKENV